MGSLVDLSFICSSPWFLLLACTGVALAAFLLYQTAAFQKWALANQPHAPRSEAGIFYGIGVSLLVGGAATRRLALQHRLLDPDSLARAFQQDPALFVPIPTLMIVPMSAIAVYKFLVAAAGMQKGSGADGGRLTFVPLVGAGIAVVNLCASIATLIKFFGH